MDSVEEEQARCVSRRALFEEWRKGGPEAKCDDLYRFVMNQLGLEHCNNDIVKIIKHRISNETARFKSLWVKSSRNTKRFLSSHCQWLDGFVNFSDEVRLVIPTTSASTSVGTKVFRPRKLFDDSSVRTNRRKIKELVNATTPSALVAATQSSLRASGKRDAAALVGELALASPQRATKHKKARLLATTDPKGMSADQALALIVHLKLSVNQYKELRGNAKRFKCDLYPPFHDVQVARKKCYPALDSVSVCETSAEVTLQDLLEHTATRLCQRNDVHFVTEDLQYTLISKWGCDGSSEHSRYKQKFTEDSSQSDENLFCVSIVPLQLFLVSSSANKTIIWRNERPSSTRYCRPIKLNFMKESSEIINKEVNHIQDQIDKLVPSEVAFSEKTVYIKHNLLFTMVDGKVCSALSTYKSFQRCYICGASPKEMNRSDASNSEIDHSALAFGMSPLHAWIRFFECLLDIAYRLNVRKWAVKSQEDKEKLNKRKEEIQRKFREETGLNVDMPKKGSGNTNDGNTARRFFRNEKLSSAITGISEDLIHNFRIILETLSCGLPISKAAFGEYAKETRKLYLDNYSWYYMPPSVHNVLVHGVDIVDQCILPIGELSGEAQEARNKDNRYSREHFTRKTSRIDSITNLFHVLLISSDPYISSLRKSSKLKSGDLPPEVLSLLSSSHTDLQM